MIKMNFNFIFHYLNKNFLNIQYCKNLLIVKKDHLMNFHLFPQ